MMRRLAPRRARSQARVRPVGPAPTISTGVCAGSWLVLGNGFLCAYFRSCQKENSSLEGIRSNNPLLRARRLLQASEIAGHGSQRSEKEKTMPLTAESIVAPGGRPIRKLMFGLAAWKFWRSNPSTTEMLSAGQVFLREDMRNFNPKYVEAWLFEFDIKMQRK